MKTRKFKWVILLVLFILITSTVVYGASGYYRNIRGNFGKLKVEYNGKDVTSQANGFIRQDNGTSYLPLRGVGEVFGVNVGWDAATSTAVLSDGAGNVSVMKQRIAMQEAEIERLSDEITNLRYGGSDGGTSNGSYESGSIALRDLERDLRRDYGSYERIDFDIYLRGTTRDVDVEIEVDLDRDRDWDRWNNLRERDRERLIENIVDDIQREYRDANVRGYIRDRDRSRNLYNFDKTPKGRLYVNERDSWYTSSLRGLERDLEDRYYDDLDGLRVRIELSGDTDDIVFDIFINKDYDDYRWTRLNDRSVERLMKNIRTDIEDEHRRAIVEGHIWDRDGVRELAYLRGYDFYRDNFK